MLRGGDPIATSDFTGAFGFENGGSSLVTADGMAYLFGLVSPECSFSGTDICGALFVDVNGPKKNPAKMGRDIFIFFVAKQGIIPFLDENDETNNCTTDQDGLNCATKVLNEDSMNY